MKLLEAAVVSTLASTGNLGNTVRDDLGVVMAGFKQVWLEIPNQRVNILEAKQLFIFKAQQLYIKLYIKLY